MSIFVGTLYCMGLNMVTAVRILLQHSECIYGCFYSCYPKLLSLGIPYLWFFVNLHSNSCTGTIISQFSSTAGTHFVRLMNLAFGLEELITSYTQSCTPIMLSEQWDFECLQLFLK